jgi:hypothetical protein
MKAGLMPAVNPQSKRISLVVIPKEVIQDGLSTDKENA